MSRSLRRYKQWHNLEPRGEYTADVDLDTKEPWVEIGKACEIVYWSDKWNRADAAKYEHKFAVGFPRLIAHPYQDVLLICGGKFSITERGLLK